jgi:DUF4097 and DUF4098 domain-containing protein YvlB
MTKSSLLSFVLSAAILFVCGSALAAVAEETVENTYSVPEKASITVKNADGRIQVYGWEENEIKVTAFKRAFTKERLDAIEINVEIADDSALIDTIYPPALEGSIIADRSGTVEYLILVPQYATITKLELANGEMLVEGMRGASIHAQVGNGKLLMRNCFAPTHVSLTKGIMDIFFGWWEDTGSPFRAELADGNMRVGLPGTAAVLIDAASTTGRVTNDFAKHDGESGGEDGPTSTVQVGYDSGSTLELRTNSGNIRIEKIY